MAPLLPFFVLAVTERQPDGTLETVSYIPLDVRERSGMSLSSQVSDNPVEAGTTVADHVIKDPRRITLEGLVSDSPVGQTRQNVGLQGDDEQVSPGSRAMSCYQAFNDAWEKSSPLTVINELGVFDDMMIENLEFPREQGRGGNAIWFELTLKQITVVESQSASLPPDIVQKLKLRRTSTTRKLSTRQHELAARKAKETATGKTSTETPASGTSATTSSAASNYSWARVI